MHKYRVLMSFVAAAQALALAAHAAPTVTAPPETCAGIQWSPEFLKSYPKAPVTCREVTMHDGVKFAKFNGKVAKVGQHFVQVAMSDVADIPVSTIAFEIGVGGRVTIGDEVKTVKDLKVGDVLTFWVREQQFGISPTLSDRPMAIVQPEAMPAE